MKTLGRILGILCASTFLMAATTLHAAPLKFSRVIFFGDSLSDIANNQSGQDDQAPVTTKNPDGSNGEIWVQPFVRDLKADGFLMNGATTNVRPSRWYDESKEILPGDSVDFAYSGDASGGFLSKLKYMFHPANEQGDCTFDPNSNAGDNGFCGAYNRIYHYAAKYGADPNALYVIWVGPNDIIHQLQPGIIQQIMNGINLQQAENDPRAAAVVQALIVNIYASVQELYDAGAQHVVVMNLPNLGMTPEGKMLSHFYNALHPQDASQDKVKTLFTYLTTQVNANLKAQLAKASHPVIQPDFMALFDIAENGKLAAFQPAEKDYTNPFTNKSMKVNVVADLPWMGLSMNGMLTYYTGCCQNQKEGPNYIPQNCIPDPSHKDFCDAANRGTAKVGTGDTHYYLFYDAIHPTACTHKYIARYVEAYLDNLQDPSKTPEQYFVPYEAQNLCAS